jgi:hypothetical protein
MKIRDLRKLLVGLDGDIDVIIHAETSMGYTIKDCHFVEVKDNGEKKFFVISNIDPNEDPAERATREFMRRR